MTDECNLTFARADVDETAAVHHRGWRTYKRILAVFNFSIPKFGFGEIVIASNPKTGDIAIDAETMSKETVKRLLCAMVDNAILDSDEDPEKQKIYDDLFGRIRSVGDDDSES